MKKYIILICVIILTSVNLAVVYSETSEEEICYTELVSDNPILEDNYENYSVYTDSFSNLNPLGDPFINLPFDTPLVFIRFINVGDESSLRVGNWPTYHKYNFYEIYVDDPRDFETSFIGCGLMEITPKGDYELNSLDVESYGFADLDSYEIIRNSNARNKIDRIFETTQLMRDVDSSPFLEMKNTRIYIDDGQVYFTPSDYIDLFADAINAYTNGDNDAMYNYLGDVIDEGEHYVEYLTNYDLYQDSQKHNSGIGDSNEPTEFESEIEPVKYSPTLGETVSDNDLNDLINIINQQGRELEDWGLISSYDSLNSVDVGTTVNSSTFSRIQIKLNSFMTTIGKDSLFEEISSYDLITENELEIIKNNLNKYLQNKHCENDDFSCSSWTRCSSGSTSRNVDRERGCIGNSPTTSNSCAWTFHRNGARSTQGSGCRTAVFQERIHRDVHSETVSDYCGVFSLNQWLGHTRTTRARVGTVDNCDAGGGNGGPGGAGN